MIELELKTDRYNIVPDSSKKATLGYIRLLCYESKMVNGKLEITDNLLLEKDFRLLDSYKDRDYDSSFYYDIEEYLVDINDFTVLDKYKKYKIYIENMVNPCEKEVHNGIERKRKIDREKIIIVPYVSNRDKFYNIQRYKDNKIMVYHNNIELQPSISVKDLNKKDLINIRNLEEILNYDTKALFDISNVKYKKEIKENDYKTNKEYNYTINASSSINPFTDIVLNDKNEIFDVYVKEEIEMDSVVCSLSFDITKDNTILDPHYNYKFEDIKIDDIVIFKPRRFEETNFYEKFSNDSYKDNIFVIESIETEYKKNSTTKKIKAIMKVFNKTTKELDNINTIPYFYDSDTRFICDYTTDDISLRETKKNEDIEKSLTLSVKNMETLMKYIKDGFDLNTNVLIQTNSFIKQARINSIEFNPFNYEEPIDITFYQDLFSFNNVNKNNIKSDIAVETNRVRREYVQGDERLSKRISNLRGGVLKLKDNLEDSIDLETHRNIHRAEGHIVNYQRTDVLIKIFSNVVHLLIGYIINNNNYNNLKNSDELLGFYNNEFFMNPLDTILEVTKEELSFMSGLKEEYGETLHLDTLYENIIKNVIKAYVPECNVDREDKEEDK